MRFGITTIAMLVWTGLVSAQPPFDLVMQSRHNLSPKGVNGTNGANGAYAEGCIYCHSEPSDDETAGKVQPKWHPDNQLKTFPSTAEAFKEDVPPKGLPIGPSFDCMTCHDGAIGNDVHQTGVGGMMNAAALRVKALNEIQNGRAVDHPILNNYPRKPTGEFVGEVAIPQQSRYWSIPDRDEDQYTLPTGPVSPLLDLKGVIPDDPATTSVLIRTFQGKMHCDTCHTPHDGKIRPFLRVNPRDLCLVCHDR
jgi:predicted CXXCH cytochrome family protein